MNDRENKSAKVAHDSMELTAQHRTPTPAWAMASRCKRPPLKPAACPSLLARVLTMLGVK